MTRASRPPDPGAGPGFRGIQNFLLTGCWWLLYIVPNIIKRRLPMKPEYSTFQAKEILGIEYVRLNEWLRGYFDPEQRAKGRGTRTKFSLNDLYRLKLFAILVDLGISRSFSGETCNNLRGVDFSSGFIAVAKGALKGSFYRVGPNDKKPPYIKNITKTDNKGNSEIIELFPAQITISLPTIKGMVDSSLSD
jgi:hypothetical protein